MNSLNLFRICRPCLARAARVVEKEHILACVSTRSHGRRQTVLPGPSQASRLYSTEVPPATTSEMTDVYEDGERVSQFRQQRQQTLKEDAMSEDPVYKESYPRLEHRDDPISVPELRETLDPLTSTELEQEERYVSVYGRVRSRRKHGHRLIFLDIVNQFERIQVMINFKRVKGEGLTFQKFKLFARLIEAGDHISVTGIVMRSGSGELTVNATMLPELLSPALEQIPEKLMENRMQRRHVDLLVNREASDTLRLRSYVTKYLRDYLHSQRFLEYQTPIISAKAGGAAARPFTTTSTVNSSKELQLRIAPELWLKRLVVGGVDKVFEIGPVFRDEGIDATHNPEFTMCEFYSAYSNLDDLIKQTEDIICGLAQHCQELISTKLRSLKPLDLRRFNKPFKRIEFIPALEEALGFRFPKLSSETALPDLLAALALNKTSIPGDTPTTLPKLLDRLSAIYLEPKSLGEPVFITHHPSCMSPLAKSFVCPKTYQFVSARTEIFWNGRELANMYEEENDPFEQRNKLRLHQSLINTEEGGIGMSQPQDSGPNITRVYHRDRDADPLDANYVQAIRTGLPPTGGWGCGVERLVMMFSGAERISDCLSFGSIRNVMGLSATEGGMPDNENDVKGDDVD